jgi:antitoxin component YwqK of YwqJK toxin-antitoxin module
MEKSYNESGTLASEAKYKNGILQGNKKCRDGRFGNESLDCFEN